MTGTKKNQIFGKNGIVSMTKLYNLHVALCNKFKNTHGAAFKLNVVSGSQDAEIYCLKDDQVIQFACSSV